MKRLLTHVTVAASAAALAAGWTAFADSGPGHSGGGDDNSHRGHRGGELFETVLAPSDPADDTLNGVQPGGAPWVLRRGRAELSRRGRLEVRVRGLVIPDPPGDDTPGPVNTISASLFCGNSTTPADETGERPLSDAGNARIKERLDLPDDCLGPRVFVHPNGDQTRYIAVSGFKD